MVSITIKDNMESPEYLFFIFDEEIMQQREDDDIEEAILLYHPTSSFLEGEEENDIYLLFGHIVGTVKCIETLSGALPSLIRLEKSKFAVIRNTHYLLFLGFNIVANTIPDSYLKKKLEKFLNIFSFYHGSFERLVSSNKNDEGGFILDLELISSNYLSFALGNDVPTQSIFDPLPTITFNKATSSIFSKAAQILETCQRRESIYCGCLFAESNVICSQVSSKLVHHLLLLKANQKGQDVSVFYPGFDCPVGVRILRVYVTKEQYEEIINLSLQSPYSTSGNTSVSKTPNNSNDCKNNSKDTLNVRDRCLRKTFSGSSMISSKEESEETRSLVMMSSIASEILKSTSIASDSDLHSDKENRKIYTCSLPKGSSISANLLDTLNMDALIVSDTFDEHNVSIDINSSVDDPKSDKLSDRNDLPIFHLANSENTSADNTTNANDTGAVPTASRKENSENDEHEVLDDMLQLHLYVQAHSDVVLVLFMEVQVKYEYKSLKSLWEMLLPCLGDIEAQVKTLAISTGSNSLHNAGNICFIKYDNVVNKCETNLPADVTNNVDCTFVNSVNTFHHQFESSSVSDVTFIKANSTYGYAHKSPFEERYIQQRGNYRPSPGPPVNNDALWRADQLANHKLKKVTKSNMLL